MKKDSAEHAIAEAAAPKESSSIGVGAAVLAGLSLLGVACTANPGQAVVNEIRVEAPPEGEICLKQDLPTARVIVVDDFWKADEHTTHGEIVETELARDFQVGENADITMERQVVSVWDGEHGIDKGTPGSLESYLRSHFAGRMTRDADAMQRILDGGGPRGVIHQSQGASQSRAIDPIYYRAIRDNDFGIKLQEQLGMDPTNLDSRLEKAELLQRLLQTADSMYSQDEAVLQARQRLRGLQDQLHERGFIHVISAGNQGFLYRDMVELGVDIPSNFFTNDFASEHSIIVGAADNQSKEVRGETFGVANLANPNAGAHIAADGVDRPLTVDGNFGHHSGSSYAAPQVSNEVLDMLRMDPDITRDEVLQQLQQAATPVPGAESFLGAGILAHPGMLLCHQ
ncbi:MAG: S8 family serine peptidase [Candidatus Eremiobacteraeota bacterium]|nr:S8 family serine peptidase [Candidatus Eremiobacteraeota bacterium]